MHAMKRFPDCTLHFCEQRTPEWFALRQGVLTASQFGPWLAKSDKTSEKACLSAVCQTLAEFAGCESPPVFENWAMKRGTELEPQAAEHFEQYTGLKVQPVGFCKAHGMPVGCSPDGLIVDQNIGFEGKAPIPATHVKYLLNGGLPDEYREQVHGSMAVTGAEAWWFQSYCPGLPTLRIKVERDNYTEQILAGLRRFSEAFESARAKVEELWCQQYNAP